MRMPSAGSGTASSRHISAKTRSPDGWVASAARSRVSCSVPRSITNPSCRAILATRSSRSGSSS